MTLGSASEQSQLSWEAGICYGFAGLSGLFLLKSSIPKKPQAAFVLRKGRGAAVHVHIHIPHRSREARLGQHRALGEWQKLFLFTRLRRQEVKAGLPRAGRRKSERDPRAGWCHVPAEGMQLPRTAAGSGHRGRQDQPRSPGGAFRAEILRRAGQTPQGKGQEKAQGEVQEEAEA